MAVPMTASEFKKALVAEGVKVREHKGWATHNRNSKGSWGPLHGVMLHHTASGSDGIESYVYNGTSDLPGPLCHALIQKDGTVVLIGWGRANHAGGGDPQVLSAVIAETYPLPATNEHEGSSGAVDGNAHFVGYECVNQGDGKDPWPDVQVEAMARATAAVCRFYGWTVGSALRHLDWSDWKSDPKGIDWTAFRKRVTALLAAPAGAGGTNDESASTKPPTAPAKPPAATKPTVKPLPSVSVSNLIKAYNHDRPAKTGATSYPADVKLFEAALVKLGFLASTYAKDGSFGTTTETGYNAFRRSIGLKGSDAIGAPGKLSVTQLGQKSGLFTTKN